MHRHRMIVGVNTGFHEAPFCRVRSARRARQGRATTAASLGREAIFNDTRTLDESKTSGASGIFGAGGCRGHTSSDSRILYSLPSVTEHSERARTRNWQRCMLRAAAGKNIEHRNLVLRAAFNLTTSFAGESGGDASENGRIDDIASHRRGCVEPG